MNFNILSCAEQELFDAVDYYNEQSPGLGYEFAAEIKKTFERIEDFPEAWPLISERTRRCMTTDSLMVCCIRLKRQISSFWPSCT